MVNTPEELRQGSLEQMEEEKYRDGVGDDLKSKSPKDPQDISEIRRRGWNKRKRVTLMVVDLLRQGNTVNEIVAETEFQPKQVRNARERARAQGLLAHPSAEQTAEAKSRAHMRQPSPMKSRTHSFETIVNMTQRRRGRELTDIEKEQIALLVTARQIPLDRGKPTLDQLYIASGRKPITRGTNRSFLEIFYAARICLEDGISNNTTDDEKERPFLRMQDIDPVYEQVDPDIFNRLSDEIIFIRTKTKHSLPKKGTIYESSKNNFGRARRP